MEPEAVASRCEKLIETLLAATAEARPQLAEAGKGSWGYLRVLRSRAMRVCDRSSIWGLVSVLWFGFDSRCFSCFIDFIGETDFDGLVWRCSLWFAGRRADVEFVIDHSKTILADQPTLLKLAAPMKVRDGCVSATCGAPDSRRQF
jgi:hypothetical protein